MPQPSSAIKPSLPRPEGRRLSVEGEINLAVDAFTKVLPAAARAPQFVKWPKGPDGAFLPEKAIDAAMERVRAVGWKVSFETPKWEPSDTASLILRAIKGARNTVRPPDRGSPGWADIRISAVEL
jgi:hypothetical protein